MNKYKIVIHTSGSTDSFAYRATAKSAVNIVLKKQREEKEMSERLTFYSGVCCADIYRRSSYLRSHNGKPCWVLVAKVNSNGAVHAEDPSKSEDGKRMHDEITSLQNRLAELYRQERDFVSAADAIELEVNR